MKKMRLHQAELKRRGEEIASGSIKSDTTVAHITPGGGKAQSLDSLVLTPLGYKKMGDIKVGDLVCCPDGSAASVTHVFPQGNKEMFEVNFSDGTSTECCDDHLWYVDTPYSRSARAGIRKTRIKRRECVKSLKTIRKNLVVGGKHNYSIPMVSDVCFTQTDLPLAPYLLGLLLGDGCFRNSMTKLSTADHEIVLLCESIVPKDVSIHKVKEMEYSFVGRGAGRHNPITEIIKRLGLGEKLSQNKFIPEIYKFASRANRIEILRGLLDTDGTVGKPGNNRKAGSSCKVSFTTVSKQLAKDVRFIVESLGGVASIDSRYPHYTYNSVRRKGQLAYTLRIGMPPTINPFRLKRKADLFVPRSKYPPTRYIVSVKSIGVKPAQCISIDHPDNLYITNNFIVTHNSLAAAVFSRELLQAGKIDRVVWVCPRTALVQQGADGFRDPDFNPAYSARAADNTPPLFREVNNGKVCYVTTYQSVAARPDLHFKECSLYKYLLILDEPHHLKDDEAENASWVRPIDDLVGNAQHTLLMTGTIERHDKKLIPYLEYEEEGNYHFPKRDILYSRFDALLEEAIVPIDFIYENGWAQFEDDEGLHNVEIAQATDEELSPVIQTFLGKTEFRDKLLHRGLDHWVENRKTYKSRLIVVCASQAMARAISKEISHRHQKCEVSLAISDDPRSDKVIKAFRRKEFGHALVTVGMAYEGLDVPDCKHMICLTDYRSDPWLEQAFARVTRVDYDAVARGIPYAAQKSFIFVPDDPSMRRVVSRLESEQDRGIRIKKQREQLEEKEAKDRSEAGVTFKPIGATSTGVTTGNLNVQGANEVIASLSSPVVIEEDEKELRKKIEILARRRDRMRRLPPGSTNRLTMTQFGKPRSKMGVVELRRVLVYLTDVIRMGR